MNRCMPLVSFNDMLIVSLGSGGRDSWCMSTQSGWQDSKCIPHCVGNTIDMHDLLSSSPSPPSLRFSAFADLFSEAVKRGLKAIQVPGPNITPSQTSPQTPPPPSSPLPRPRILVCTTTKLHSMHERGNYSVASSARYVTIATTVLYTWGQSLVFALLGIISSSLPATDGPSRANLLWSSTLEERS